MKYNDKIVVAFLVSLGMFSVAQAGQYISTLSSKQKKELVEIKELSKGMLLADRATASIEGTWEQSSHG
ncbi:MAG: hypothetical protein A2270_03840 [Elusimicrobia bacterium RIFOXYA12_FULL_51_18]|nr:MAG: hypothetical protein A2270_03840 [Elusimicrobia bacterium RIFOXYA12_FULL_51_18]OGS29883.1 MAG: hypothetical protein A2218_02540 [Elusimicrobia bacterium RIFOXYA2_FULL_53_38]